MKTIDEIQKELGISDEEMARQMVKNGLAATIQDALFQLAISKGEITGDVIEVKSTIKEIVYKHMTGQHNQKRHGWRYSGVSGARSSMRGQDKTERSEYRKRAGMPEPVKKVKVETVKFDSSKPADLKTYPKDTKGWEPTEILVARYNKQSQLAPVKQAGIKRGDFFIYKPEGKGMGHFVVDANSGISLAYVTGKARATKVASILERNLPSMKGRKFADAVPTKELMDAYKKMAEAAGANGYNAMNDWFNENIK